MVLRVIRYHRPGQSIVLVALAMLALMGALGLALDGGNAFNKRRQANNAADAAAMAGTRILIRQQQASGDGTPINDAIARYLDDHLGSGAYTSTSYYIDRQAHNLGNVVDGRAVPSGSQGVVVEVHYTFPTFFLPLLGWNTLTVGGQGTALYGPLGSAIGADLIPLAIKQTAYDTFKNSDGHDVQLNLFGPAADSYQVAPGNFGQVSFDPAGSNQTGNYSQDCIQTPAQHEDSQSRWWCQGSQYQIQIGQTLHGQTGTLASSLEDEIEWRIAHRPRALVPVVATVSGSGDNTIFRVVGFLAVDLQSVDLTGPNESRKVVATYVDYFTTPGAIVGQGNGIDFGTYAINLVR